MLVVLLFLADGLLVFTGWEDWAGLDAGKDLHSVLRGALTVRPDTRTDPYFDDFMTAVS